MNDSQSSAVDKLYDNGTITPSRMNPETSIFSDQINAAPITLNKDDPFEAVVIEMVEMNRRKRSDYALDGDPFSNFHQSSAMLGIDGFGPIEACLFQLGNKLSRLNSLRKNGKLDSPTNETVEDTYLDIAVYATILFAMVRSFK